ncbi:NAD(P)H-dependent flavin oxidoreductase [Streptomyces sp. NPDC017936]|uniref:NAD(P)H-dependent flavin oxidoreductase n=1 Tax=Streptomyces sp. NPDC017936 TaxID=3365016 RepID=UPI00378AC015
MIRAVIGEGVRTQPGGAPGHLALGNRPHRPATSSAHCCGSSRAERSRPAAAAPTAVRRPDRRGRMEKTAQLRSIGCRHETTMLRTWLCDVLGIEVPLIGAPYGPFDQVELAAAVCEAGGLGTAVRPVADLRRQWSRMRELTDRPFAINHTLRPLNEEAFQATLDERPAAISFHLGVPDDLVERAHDAGILWCSGPGHCHAAGGRRGDPRPNRAGRPRLGRP